MQAIVLKGVGNLTHLLPRQCLDSVNTVNVLQRWLGDTRVIWQDGYVMFTLQIERQLPSGAWTLHCDGRRFKDADEAWKLVYGIMDWRPGMRLRLCAFRKDPYESTAKYLYPELRGQFT